METYLRTILSITLFYSVPNFGYGQDEVASWTDPSWAKDSKSISYSSYDGNDWEIYIVDIFTAVVKQITNTDYDESSPSWSPDGSRLIFETNKDGNVEIYTIDLTNGELGRLTNNLSEDSEPVYSPEGSTIAFSSYRLGNPQIFLMNNDGGNVRPLTIQGRNEMANWSPDGKRIVFHSNLVGHWEIFIVEVDGKNLWSPTHDPDEKLYGKWDTSESRWIGVPSFSPNGEVVIFHSSPEQDQWGIYSVDLSTNEWQVCLDTKDANESYPALSPDGKWLAYQYLKDGERTLRISEIETREVKILTKLQYPKQP